MHRETREDREGGRDMIGAIRHFFSRILEIITDWYMEDSGMYIDIEKLKRDRLGPDTHIVTTPITETIKRCALVGIGMNERIVPYVKHPEAVMVKGTSRLERAIKGLTTMEWPEPMEHDNLSGLGTPINSYIKAAFKVCGACGKKAENNHKFCMECGTVL
jgi:hypothetical protein